MLTTKTQPKPPILCHVEYEWLVESQHVEAFIEKLKTGMPVDKLLDGLPENFGLTTVHTEAAPVFGFRVVQAVFSVQHSLK